MFQLSWQAGIRNSTSLRQLQFAAVDGIRAGGTTRAVPLPDCQLASGWQKFLWKPLPAGAHAMQSEGHPLRNGTQFRGSSLM